VTALKQDDSEVVHALKKEWAACLLRTLTRSNGDLNVVQQRLANNLRMTKPIVPIGYCRAVESYHDIVKRDGSTESIQGFMTEPLYQKRKEVIGAMDSETALPLALGRCGSVHCGRLVRTHTEVWRMGTYDEESGEEDKGTNTIHSYCTAQLPRVLSTFMSNKVSTHGVVCSACKELTESSCKMVDQRCEELLGQMDINAVRAELENDHNAEDIVITALLHARLAEIEGTVGAY